MLNLHALTDSKEIIYASTWPEMGIILGVVHISSLCDTQKDN